MDIRYKLYPHPVLKGGTDDYKTSSFSCEMSQERGHKKFLMSATFSLDNPQLRQLIEDEKVEYVLHIESALSSYRSVLTSKEPHISFQLKDSKLLDRVSLCPFLLAKVDIPNYTNTDFNEDYAGTGFSIEKGTILAIALQQVFHVEKDKNNLADLPSIFKIYRKMDLENKPPVIELNQDYIKIGMNERDFIKYQTQCQGYTNVVNGFVIFPFLICAFDYLRKDYSELEELKWVKSVKLALKSCNLTLNQELLDQKSSLDLAQILLKNPISTALEEIEDKLMKLEDEE